MDEIIQFNRETLTNVKNWINRMIGKNQTQFLIMGYQITYLI